MRNAFAADSDPVRIRQIHSLLDPIRIEESVLYECGSTGDTVGPILAKRGCKVTTNGANHMLVEVLMHSRHVPRIY